MTFYELDIFKFISENVCFCTFITNKKLNNESVCVVNETAVFNFS